MENRHPLNGEWRWLPTSQVPSGASEAGWSLPRTVLASRVEERADDPEYRALEGQRSQKRFRRDPAEPRQAPGADMHATLEHARMLEARETWLRGAGVSNRDDPITQTPLQAGKPLALLVEETSGRLYAFDLHSLYHAYLKRGKTWLRCLNGRFKLDSDEQLSLLRDYHSYYGA